MTGVESDRTFHRAHHPSNWHYAISWLPRLCPHVILWTHHRTNDGSHVVPIPLVWQKRSLSFA